jgi:hypothetical protein
MRRRATRLKVAKSTVRTAASAGNLTRRFRPGSSRETTMDSARNSRPQRPDKPHTTPPTAKPGAGLGDIVSEHLEHRPYVPLTIRPSAPTSRREIVVSSSRLRNAASSAMPYGSRRVSLMTFLMSNDYLRFYNRAKSELTPYRVGGNYGGESNGVTAPSGANFFTVSHLAVKQVSASPR